MNVVTSAASTKLYRAFLVDGARSPLCGAEASMLGVRGLDVAKALDAEGTVHPGRGGMSVTPNDPALLPPFLRPASLGGHGELPVFVIESTMLGAALTYRPDPKKPHKHGFVEPASAVLLDAYQTALADTKAQWKEVPL